MIAEGRQAPGCKRRVREGQGRRTGKGSGEELEASRHRRMLLSHHGDASVVTAVRLAT